MQLVPVQPILIGEHPMKKQLTLLSLFLAAVCFLTTNALAVGGGGGGGGGGGSKSSGSKSSQSSTKTDKTADKSNAELEDLTSKLTLTDPQKAAVKSILDGRDVQLAALKKQKMPKDEAKAKTTEVRDAANEKIRSLLTPAQQTIFDKTVKHGGKKNKTEAPATASAPASTTP
jgi:hypothetical protein